MVRQDTSRGRWVVRWDWVLGSLEVASVPASSVPASSLPASLPRSSVLKLLEQASVAQTEAASASVLVVQSDLALERWSVLGS